MVRVWCKNVGEMISITDFLPPLINSVTAGPSSLWQTFCKISHLSTSSSSSHLSNVFRSDTTFYCTSTTHNQTPQTNGNIQNFKTRKFLEILHKLLNLLSWSWVRGMGKSQFSLCWSCKQFIVLDTLKTLLFIIITPDLRWPSSVSSLIVSPHDILFRLMLQNIFSIWRLDKKAGHNLEFRCRIGGFGTVLRLKFLEGELWRIITPGLSLQ